MRSRRDYIVTKDEVYGYANEWLGSALRLEYEGTKCSTSTLLQVLLIAAARVVSIFAACRDLADAPSDQTIRNALAATLPGPPELERRLNRALATRLPKALRRKSRMVAIDLTLIPYHGQPAHDKKEIYRSAPKSGTTHFHAYGTAVVVHKGHRYTLALTRVEYGEAMKDVVQRLLRIVRRRGVKIKFLLLDKGFFSVAVISYLKRARLGFIIPAIPRGRKPKTPQPATGLRALLRQNHGYYRHTLHTNVDGKHRRVDVTVCVASKSYTQKKTGKRRRKKLLYAVWKVRRTPREIRETYRKRFGIETSYRQMNEAASRPAHGARPSDCCSWASPWCFAMSGYGCTSNSPERSGATNRKSSSNYFASKRCCSGSPKSSHGSFTPITTKASCVKPINDLSRQAD